MARASQSLQIRQYREDDQTQVVEIWQRCGLLVPWNVPLDDIACKIDYQPELFFVAQEADRLVGTVMVGYEGHRGWINYLAVVPERQGSGLGLSLMEFAESRLRELGCPKINLQVRGSNENAIGFYERIGFRLDDALSMGKRLDGKTSGGAG